MLFPKFLFYCTFEKSGLDQVPLCNRTQCSASTKMPPNTGLITVGNIRAFHRREI